MLHNISQTDVVHLTDPK